MSHTDTTPVTAEQIVSMGVRQAREAIDQIDDITLLDRIIEAEQAGKARKSLIGIARLRADGLRESGEAVISVDEAAEREAMVGITLPTGVTVPADMVRIEIGASRAEGEDTPQVAQEAPVEPETAPAEAQAAPEPEAVQEAPVEPEQGSSVDDCARAFFAALRQGNAALVAALLAEVRREGADDATMAEALVAAYNAQPARQKAGPTVKRRSREDSTELPAPNPSIMAKIEAAIASAKKHGRADDGTIRITPSDMDAAEWSASWRKYAVQWCRTGRPAIAARALGFEAKFRKEHDRHVVILTPA